MQGGANPLILKVMEANIGRMIMIYFSRNILALTGIYLICLNPATVSASLIGDTVIVREAFDQGSGLMYYDEVFPGKKRYVVGPVVEGGSDETAINEVGTTIYQTIDVDSSSFKIKFTQPITSEWGGYSFLFNGFEISDLDFAPGFVISGASILSDSINWIDGELTGPSALFTQDRIGFNDNTVYLDFAGLAGNGPGELSIQLTFSAVPLPPALWLFVAGLAGFAGFARREKK